MSTARNFDRRTPTHADDFEVDRLSEQIIGCGYRVINTLGVGFLEKVYENALVLELRQAGLSVVQQHGIVVRYNGVVVGEYSVDLLVEGVIIVELRAIRALDNTHLSQCINYLKATGLQVCLLLNSRRSRIEVRRIANTG